MSHLYLQGVIDLVGINYSLLTFNFIIMEVFD